MSEEQLISAAGERKLLAIARKSVEAAVTAQPQPEVQLDDPELQQHCGAFVTLTTHGHLRGCLGRFTADEPIYQLVNVMAAQSATEDPRFFTSRIRPDELDELRVEVSVLSPMRLIKNPLTDVKLGVHGIYVKRGGQSGTFLPQVATEHNMDLNEFLSSCCSHKAGLPHDAWKDPKTEVYVYTAQVFQEE